MPGRVDDDSVALAEGVVEAGPQLAVRHQIVSGPGIQNAYLACQRRSFWTQSRR